MDIIAITIPTSNAGKPIISWVKKTNLKFSIIGMKNILLNNPMNPAKRQIPPEIKNEKAIIAKLGIIDIQAKEASE